MIVGIEKGTPPVGVAEAKAWLRLGAGQDDAVVAGLIRAAVELCEAFTGQMLIARRVTEEFPAAPGWVSLARRPVVAIETVAGMTGETLVALTGDDWQHAVDRDGAARLSIDAPGDAARIRVTYRAGLADEANAVPEAIRQGLVRMIQHLHEARDAPGQAPPAIVAALWQPWRRLSLGAAR
ncbi:hypothetical protein EAO27_01650 [Sphingopyxis sp. YF1]|uniref:head-tail connector protein n=1 Tax=Sphingopyxis sp. YF1 TaxID=2482763 RepID=UPI001F6184A1|nr:hypothetical protein [Sphingopyxis sp. YF1]UNU41555.1 hypothetical protein EAO27_01650 [Sphingopyxis sp. YF1]